MSVETQNIANPFSRLYNAPMALYASVMGLGSLGLAWRRASLLFGTPASIGEAIMVLAAATYFTVSGVQLARAIRFRRAHINEFRHPVAASFVPAFTVATALLAAGLEPYSIELARAIWIFAASLHLLFAFIILRRWFTQTRDIVEASPAWFIPVVGIMLMPVVGVPMGFVTAGWFLFSIGFVFWLVLAPLVTHRLFFAGALSEQAAPSVFILLAPPAVGGLAILALNDGNLSPFSHVMFSFASFVACLVSSCLSSILRTHFAVGWWALTFPCGAFATLTLTYAVRIPNPLLLIGAGLSLTFATVVVAAVAVLTLRALARDELIPTE